MPRGEEPRKRFVQPLLVVTFQTATQLVEEGNLGPIEDANATDTTQHMWFDFLKKLHLRIQLNWPTELVFRLFSSFFSALVDARETAKALQLSEELEIEKLQELGDELADLSVNSASRKAQKGHKEQMMVKPSFKKPQIETSELVKTIDRFLDAVTAAGTIWISVEDLYDLE